MDEISMNRAFRRSSAIDADDGDSGWRDNVEYERFVRDKLRDPDPETAGLRKGVVWTYNDASMARYRESFNVSFGSRLTPSLTHLGLNGGSYVSIPYYYIMDFFVRYYALFPRFDRSVPSRYLVQPLYESTGRSRWNRWLRVNKSISLTDLSLSLSLSSSDRSYRVFDVSRAIATI